MSTDMMDIPYVFTATWIGLLGAYLLWMSQCSRSNKGTPDSPNFGFADGSDDADTASVTSNATEDTDEYPPFSPEGMISWVFERCNRRCESAMEAAGDTIRAQAYNQRRALLADFMNFITAANDDERDQTNDMLRTIDDISSNENRPTKDSDEGGRQQVPENENWPSGHDQFAGRNGHATTWMCKWHISNDRRFMVWICFLYNMDYASDWILMVHDALWQELQTCSGAVVS